jgi:hypothetical protein
LLSSERPREKIAKVTQDGDCEGSIVLDRLPSKGEAAEIRDILGIPKRVEYSDEVLAAKRAQFSMARQLKPVLPASGDYPVSREPPPYRRGLNWMTAGGMTAP